MTTSSANKAKGTRWESDVADHLQDTGVRARRLPRTGAKDIGDIAFPITLAEGVTDTIVVEAKNEKTINLPKYLAEAAVESEQYAAKYPADGGTWPLVVVKRRGKGPGMAYAVMELDEFILFLKNIGVL